MNNYYDEDYRIVTAELRKQWEEDSISGAGGGGCFPAGTFVRTAKGAAFIETCRVGDTVVAYDRFGKLEIGQITQVHIHNKVDYSDDLYFIYSGDILVFPKGITGNHAVYSESGEHKEIKEFIIGDILTTLNGDVLPITRISIISNGELTEPVYNFTVYPQHTYFVGDIATNTWIRVHNGGGGGGKSASAPAAAVEAPNTLRSSSVARVLEIVSHGEIVGIAAGAKGVTFNNTVLQNADNSYNFSGVVFEQRYGLPSQTYIPGFSEVEAEIAITSTTVTQATPVIQQLPGTNAQAARVTISLPEGLSLQDTTNGNLNGNTVRYKIYTKERASSTWGLIVDNTLDDKTTSPTEIIHRIPAPGTLWDIKVERVTADDASTVSRSKINFARLTEITEQTLTYNNIAYAGLTIPASSVGNSIPVRTYDVIGIKCKIPTNYDPVTRSYGAAYWNGSFTTAWTDNPAWILYDLLTNTEYGINSFLGEPLDIDIWAFYEASLYNDCVTWNGSSYSTNLIPDGFGGYEVRYLCNVVINVQTDAWQLCHAVASNMRALLCDKGSQISLIQDKPRVSRKVVTNSNVIDGLFSYSSTEGTSIGTVINCTFNDKYDRYLPKTISYPVDLTNNVAVARYGYNVKDIIAYGCVTESQALRMAKWALYSEIYQFDSVTFGMSLNIMDLSVGDVISIMDDEYITDTAVFLSGRVDSVDGTTVVLSNPVNLITGHTYIFAVRSIDATTIIERTIVNTGNTATLTLASTLPAGDYTNNDFFCYSTGFIEPRKFIIQNVTESSKGLYTLSCLFYDEDKYAFIEDSIALTPGTYAYGLSSTLLAVTNITFHEVFFNDGIASKNYIDVRWDWDEGHTLPDQVTYNLRWRRDKNNYTYVTNIPVKDFHIPDTTPGVYEVGIEVVNVQGKKSSLVYETYQYRTVAGASTLEPPENFQVLGGGLVFTGTHIPVTWTFPTANSTKSDTLLDYVLEVWSLNGETKLATYTIIPNISDKGGSFDYLYQYNTNDYGTPSRSVQFRLYSRDMIGDLSIANTKTFSNPVPGIQSFNILSGLSTVYIDVTTIPEADVTGYQVWRSLTGSFVKDNTTLVYDGPDRYIVLSVPTIETYYYAIAAYDSFGKTGLNVSSEISALPLSLDAINWTKTGLDITVNTPTANRIYWTSGTITRFVNETTNTYTISAGNALWSTGILYLYFDPESSTTTLLTTTTLGIAVATNNFPIATYGGGGVANLKGGDGSAFFSGSQVIAGTVGASQLIVGSAVITGSAQIASAIINSTHIENAVITNAHIKDYIESTSYNTTTFDGWKLDKAGVFKSYGALELYNSLGAPILTTGDTAYLNWQSVAGTGTPEDYATLGGDLGEVTTYTNVFYGNGFFTADSVYKLAGYEAKGFFMGGIQAPAEIDGIYTLTDTAFNPAAVLTTSRYDALGTSSITKGYCCGGFNNFTIVDYIIFITETVSLVTNNLSLGVMTGDSMTSSTAGYLSGYINLQIVPNLIKFIHSTETNSILTGVLADSKIQCPAIQSPTTGYRLGGVGGVTQRRSIDGIIFVSETMTDPSSALTNIQESGKGCSPNTSTGYALGGYDDNLQGFIYITETSTNPATSLAVNVHGNATLSIPNYGYTGGGAIAGGNTPIDIIQKFNASNETSLQLATTLTTARRFLAGTQG